jgi:hypothetical protein
VCASWHSFEATDSTSCAVLKKKEKKLEMPTVQERFHNNVLLALRHIRTLMQTCKENGYSDVCPEYVGAGINVLSNWQDKGQLVDVFIRSTEEDWEMLRQKDEEWFKSNMGKFLNMLPVTVISQDTLRRMFEDKNLITQDDRNYLWRILHSLVKLSVKHMYLRGEYTRDFKKLQSSWQIQDLKN